MSPEDIRELFRRHNLRCTKQREVIYAELASTTLHPSAEELYQSSKAADPEISLATVYNTLDTLCECGLARRITPGSGGPCRYDADVSDHVHVSMDGGRLVDAPPDVSCAILDRVPQPVLEDLERRLRVRIRGVNIQFIASRDGNDG